MDMIQILDLTWILQLIVGLKSLVLSNISVFTFESAFGLVRGSPPSIGPQPHFQSALGIVRGGLVKWVAYLANCLSGSRLQHSYDKTTLCVGRCLGATSIVNAVLTGPEITPRILTLEGVLVSGGVTPINPICAIPIDFDPRELLTQGRRHQHWQEFLICTSTLQ